MTTSRTEHSSLHYAPSLRPVAAALGGVLFAALCATAGIALARRR